MKWFRYGIGGKPSEPINADSDSDKWPTVEDLRMGPRLPAPTEVLAHLQPMSQPIETPRPTMKHKFTIEVTDLTENSVLHKASFSAENAKQLGQYVRRVADQVKMLDFTTEVTTSGAKAAD